MISIIYTLGFFAMFALILWVNRRDGSAPPSEGDGSAFIVGAVVGSMVWPLTLFIFVYYRFFDEVSHD
jgi:hypothetical protein